MGNLSQGPPSAGTRPAHPLGMNPVHLHLVLNHAPLFGSVISLVLLLIAMWRRSDELKKVALGLIVLTALITLPVYLTGEPAEDIVEPFPGVVRGAIDSHEDAAKIAFVSMLGTGAMALFGFWLFRGGRIIAGWFTTSLLIVLLVTGLFMARTANLGGKVRHPEIGTTSATSSQSKSEARHEDD